LKIDLSSIEPYVSGPNSVKVMNSVSQLKKKGLKINKAYLVSCVNSRFNDIKEAAEVVKGKKVADGVEFYIAAASSEVQKESELFGYWQDLINAGARPLPPGCGPCIGLGTGLLEDGEVGISATNRNFKGRMGSPNAQAYLASPAVVAASAIAGKIDLPAGNAGFNWGNGNKHIKAEIKISKKPAAKKSSVKVLPDFSSVVEGDLLFCHQDNLNTDGIYPGKYTYLDDITPEKQAEVVMENYDPEFVSIVNKGDIVAGGFNFGTGSSREQAATALLYKGIKCIVAGSFSETYARNAINNGFLVIQCAELIDGLKAKYGTEKLTVKTNKKIIIDFENSSITFDGKEYSIDPVGEAAQELIVSGGLEEWVKKNL
jgi:homoaconitate hydratase